MANDETQNPRGGPTLTSARVRDETNPMARVKPRQSVRVASDPPTHTMELRARHVRIRRDLLVTSVV